MLTLLVITLLVPATQRSGSAIGIDGIFKAVDAHEGSTVCEIGAGDGELSIAAAKLAGARGRVYASELGDDRVKTLRNRVAGSGLDQITVVAGDAVKTNFPAGACDAVFMRDVYHHFVDPAAMNASIAAALKPGGRLAIVDFTPPPGHEAPRPADRGKDGMHGVSPESVSREMKDAGFEPVTADTGDHRWFMVVVARPKS